MPLQRGLLALPPDKSPDALRTRRVFLGLAAGAGAAAAAAAAKILSGPGGQSGHVAIAPLRKVTVVESALPGDPDWCSRHLASRHGIEGYARLASVLPGEQLPLQVSSTSPEYRVVACRMGWYRVT